MHTVSDILTDPLNQWESIVFCNVMYKHRERWMSHEVINVRLLSPLPSFSCSLSGSSLLWQLTCHHCNTSLTLVNLEPLMHKELHYTSLYRCWALY